VSRMTTWRTRAQIGLRDPKAISTNINPVNGVACHYGGSGPFKRSSHADCEAILRGWQNYHMSPDNKNNYNDIAYNLAVCHHDIIMECRSTQTRPKIRGGANGNAIVNGNRYSIVCIWGANDGAAPLALKRAWLAARAFLRSKGGAGSGMNCHRDMASTSCPGDPLCSWVKAGTPMPVPTPTPIPKPVYKPPPFPTGIRPNDSSPCAVTLQRALKKKGYMASSISENCNYGPQTQKAVAKFHNANPQFKSVGVSYDPRIGPKGWYHLFMEAYGGAR